MKHHVFCRVSYSIFNTPEFFRQFHDEVGYFQIQQTIEQSLNQSFDLWFWTDKVEIKEGESRQVDIHITQNKAGLLYFKIVNA